MSNANAGYYLPEPSKWPLIGTAGLFLLLGGVALSVNGHGVGTFAMGAGTLIVLYMVFGWLGQVIAESEGGRYNTQVDRSYRWGMGWFIFSEVMFFAAFFGALFYARQFAVPWLEGAGTKAATGALLWPEFEGAWPLLDLPNPAAALPGEHAFERPERVMGWQGIPLLNTIILLSSGFTITVAHWGLQKNRRGQLLLFLGLTVALGVVFLGFQAYEYAHAYSDLNLKLTSGIYGTTFFMLTGFHGAHVTLGTIMLIVIWLRCAKGHFTPEQHFGFEGVAWYWHFVDVVWIGLFIFVYLL